MIELPTRHLEECLYMGTIIYELLSIRCFQAFKVLMASWIYRSVFKPFGSDMCRRNSGLVLDPS